MFHSQGHLVAILVQGFKVIEYLLVCVAKALPAQFLLLLLKTHKEFLCMTSYLRTRARSNMIFNHSPILAV
jgi:hypothetical protein